MRRLLNPVLPAIPNISPHPRSRPFGPARPNPSPPEAEPMPMPKPMLISPVKPPASRRKPAPTKPNPKPDPQPNPQAGLLFETARGAAARRRKGRNDLSGKKKSGCGNSRIVCGRRPPTPLALTRPGRISLQKRRADSKGAQRRRGESSRRETALRRFSASGTAQRRAPIEAGRFSAGGQTAGAIGGSIVFLRCASPRPLDRLGAGAAISRGARFDLGLMARRARRAPP